MRGQKPIDACEGHRTKAEIEQRKNLELQVMGDIDKIASFTKAGNRKIKVPSVLTNKQAIDEYKRVALELVKMGFIGNMDISMLAVYSQTYSDYLDVCEEIAVVDPNDLKAKAMLIKIQQRYIDNMLKFSTRFGLTTVDRLRFSLPKQEKSQDEYDDF